jgi:glycosyltransferase involved in cell wall biosynthesis
MTGRIIAFVDPCCRDGYGPASLNSGGLGGTEATVLRIAGALAQRTDIMHFQNGCSETAPSPIGWVLPLDDVFQPRKPITYVVLNSWKVACKLRKAQPQARILLWLHVNPGRHNRAMAAALIAADIPVICVSRSHAAQLRHFFGDQAQPNVTFIYNPLDDALRPGTTPRDPNRLLFASAPHKGLAQVFAQFRAVRAAMPDMTLWVADPGYLAWDTGPVPEGVSFLGKLSHSAVIDEMRRALCLFYPQTGFAETFGLVMAEANAVGTPVLAHATLGANAEVLGDPAQLVNGNDPAQIIDRLRHWRVKAPIMGGNPDFRLSVVAQKWAERLGLAALPARQTRKVA